MPTDRFEPTRISRDDALLIIALRLLVARAAAADSLRWWDDESLTEPAAFVLGRIFPYSPPLAARKLALLAAEARHADATDTFPGALHLYHLDWQGADRLAMRGLSPLAADVDLRPVPTPDEFRRRLHDLAGPPPPFAAGMDGRNGGRAIVVPPAPVHVNDWRHRAVALAWAYADGEPGRPIIPLIINR